MNRCCIFAPLLPFNVCRPSPFVVVVCAVKVCVCNNRRRAVPHCQWQTQTSSTNRMMTDSTMPIDATEPVPAVSSSSLPASIVGTVGAAAASHSAHRNNEGSDADEDTKQTSDTQMTTTTPTSTPASTTLDDGGGAWDSNPSRYDRRKLKKKRKQVRSFTHTKPHTILCARCNHRNKHSSHIFSHAYVCAFPPSVSL